MVNMVNKVNEVIEKLDGCGCFGDDREYLMRRRQWDGLVNQRHKALLVRNWVYTALQRADFKVRREVLLKEVLEELDEFLRLC